MLAASEGMTKGIALLDTPDIDSVVRAHYDFAYQFLDASDLWLFMTSASRYADAPVWELLQHARERGAALGVVLSRVPPSHRTELVAHFNAMLDANGIQAENRFVIPETGIVDGFLPDDIFQPIRDWLNDTAQRADRRVAVLSQTMAGMLDTFKIRVPRLAAHVDAQVVLRTRLRREAETAYATALGGVRRGHPRRPPAGRRGAGALAGLRGERRPRRGAARQARHLRGCGAAASGRAPTRRTTRLRGARGGAPRRAAGARRLGRRTALPSRWRASGGTTRAAPRCSPPPRRAGSVTSAPSASSSRPSGTAVADSGTAACRQAGGL